MPLLVREGNTGDLGGRPDVAKPLLLASILTKLPHLAKHPFSPLNRNYMIPHKHNCIGNDADVSNETGYQKGITFRKATATGNSVGFC